MVCTYMYSDIWNHVHVEEKYYGAFIKGMGGGGVVPSNKCLQLYVMWLKISFFQFPGVAISVYATY